MAQSTILQKSHPLFSSFFPSLLFPIIQCPLTTTGQVKILGEDEIAAETEEVVEESEEMTEETEA